MIGRLENMVGPESALVIGHRHVGESYTCMGIMHSWSKMTIRKMEFNLTVSGHDVADSLA